MLQEILLSLAGGPSPLLCHPSDKENPTHERLQSFLSPAEQALLDSLARNLGQKHKDIREKASSICQSHPSPVCRAVSTTIISTHLAKFRRRILEVEKDILEENPNIVGASGIVPLSAIVGAFDGWARRLDWLWELVQSIQTPSNSRPNTSSQRAATAAGIITYLRDATHTGYEDIEEISLNLVKVAETAWLKQVSAWVLYGQHPTHGAADFFVARKVADNHHPGSAGMYGIEDSLIPPFVTKATAQSILFIGKSLNHIRERRPATTNSSYKALTPELTLLSTHLAQLSALQYPLKSSSFSAAIGAIRLSLSQNALQRLLPITEVLGILKVLKDFFFLERGEFAIALITAADDRLSSRNKTDRLKPNLADSLASMTLKDGEVSAVLARTWTALASLQSLDDEDVDEELDHARELIHLSIKRLATNYQKPQESTHEVASVSFDDILLPASTVLSLHVPPPLDLFLSLPDVDVYSHIHAYLLAIRRAHMHLSKLYLLSVLRRNHPSPKVPSTRNQHNAFDVVAQVRAKANERTHAMRPIWATVSHAAVFLAEVGEYFQGEVVRGSWSTLYSWLTPSLRPEVPSTDANFSSSIGSAGRSLGSRPPSSRSTLDFSTHSPPDPETMSQVHRRYLERLQTELLLNNAEFTSSMRRFMTSVDHLAALMQRLSMIQQSLDSQDDDSMDSDKSHLEAEARRVMDELMTARSRVADGVQTLIEVLRTIDAARNNARQYKSASVTTEPDGFVPWIGAIDRLLLKFDFGNIDKMEWAAV